MEDRRRHTRLHQVMTAEVEGDFPASRLFVIDISSSGFRATGELFLPKDTDCAMTLRLDRDGPPLRGRARVMWTSELASPDMYQLGFRFTELDPGSEERLLQAVTKVRTKASQIESLRAGTNTLRTLTPEQVERMRVLVLVSEMLNESVDIEDVLQNVIDVVVEALGAERGFVMLDRGAAVPEVAAARGLDLEAVHRGEVWYSTRVVEAVMVEGEGILSVDAVIDPRFRSSESVQLLGTRSVICVPLRSRNTRGLVYLDNAMKAGVFSEADLALAKIVAALSAAAIDRALYFSTMLRNEKMGALGRLVAGLAHELLNPLMAIRSAGQILTRQGASLEQTDTVISQADRCASLVRDLLRTARGEKTPYEDLSLQQLLESTLPLLKVDFRERKVDLVHQFAPDLPLVHGNADQLRQVLVNLLSNACEACEGTPGARVTIEGTSRSGIVRLRIHDNGRGIAPEHMDRLFEPFFTTRDQGTGLGLSIVHRIVTEHGGTVTAHSGPEWTVFQVDLPAV
ncbi:MAG: ATP-binding protein [Vulcanimicrobiota bacterium]